MTFLYRSDKSHQQTPHLPVKPKVGRIIPVVPSDLAGYSAEIHLAIGRLRVEGDEVRAIVLPSILQQLRRRTKGVACQSRMREVVVRDWSQDVRSLSDLQV